MSTVIQREVIEPEKKRRTGAQAVKLSERGAFVVQELLKLRRMTMPQVAQLCRMPHESDALKFFVLRLRALGLVTMDDVMVGCAIVPLLKLTESGHRQAATALGRDHAVFYRDYVRVDFCAHLIRTNDLYLALVAEGARDWASVRRKAAAFDWRASNDNTQFIWEAPGEFESERKQRRVVPDVTVETAERRYLIEIERSTKTQRAVERKFEQYCHLFSRLKNVEKASAYASRYRDDKKPSVVFVFDSEERALNAKRHFEKRANLPGYHIPAWSTGTVESIAREMRVELFSEKPRASAPLWSDESQALVRQYVLESTKQLVTIRDAVQAGTAIPCPDFPPSLQRMRDLLRTFGAGQGRQQT